jgi:hypothetical protein
VCIDNRRSSTCTTTITEAQTEAGNDDADQDGTSSKAPVGSTAKRVTTLTVTVAATRAAATEVGATEVGATAPAAKLSVATALAVPEGAREDVKEAGVAVGPNAATSGPPSCCCWPSSRCTATSSCRP